MFNPRTTYDVTYDSIAIKEFSDYKEEYVVRPPYQRKSVWSRKNKQNLLDSLFRRYYIPRIVIRLVRLDEERTVKEVIDGQQRITQRKSFLPTNFLCLTHSKMFIRRFRAKHTRNC